MSRMVENASIGSASIEYASFIRRLKAFAYDYLIIFAYIAALFAVNFGITLRSGALAEVAPLFASPIVKDAIAFMTLVLPVALYFTFQESSPHQASWGKRRVGIRVINADGGRLTRGKAFMRSLVKLLPWQIAHTSIYHIEGFPFAPVEPKPAELAGFVLVYVLVGVYILSALISETNRTPYDWAADSYVVVQKG